MLATVSLQSVIHLFLLFVQPLGLRMNGLDDRFWMEEGTQNQHVSRPGDSIFT